MRSVDEVYASLAYDGAPLLCVPVCVSRALPFFMNYLMGEQSIIMVDAYVCVVT